MSDTEPEFFNDNKTHKLMLGSTFKKHSSTAFHTVRYDFKPASVDQNQEGELEVSDGNEVSISLPHVQGSKTSCTVYKGSKKPAQKECVLIYNNQTGEFTLERVNSQIQVKKTRLAPNANFSANPSLAPAAPKLPKMLMNKKQKSSNANRSTNKKQDVSNIPQKKQDERFSMPSSQESAAKAKVSEPVIEKLEPAPQPPQNDSKAAALANITGIGSQFSTDESHSSSSSSSSSSSDDDSGASSDENVAQPAAGVRPMGTMNSQLQEDLELSSSGSDSE